MGNRLNKIVDFEDLKWTPLIKGFDLAPVDGDLNAEGGPFLLSLRGADRAKIPAHWHPTDENITVLKGTLLVGMGETFDETKLQAMNAGNFVSVPKEMRHFAMSKGETIVQVHGSGPFQANWVNPSEVQPPDAAPRSNGEATLVIHAKEGKLPNFRQDRKEKCDELKPTDADAGPGAHSFTRRGGTVDAAFPTRRLSGALHSPWD